MPIAPSPACRAAVTRGHIRTTRAKLHTIDGTYLRDLPVTGGSVRIDGTAGNGARGGSITVTGIPARDIIGHRIDVEYVIDQTWTIPVGQWIATSAGWALPGGEVDINLGDWAAYPQRARWEQWAVWDASIPVMDVISAAAWAGRAGSPIIGENDLHGVLLGGPLHVAPDVSPWKTASDLAQKYGCTARFDREGRITVVNPADFSAPVDTLQTGPGGVVNTITTGIDFFDGGLHNKAIVYHSRPDSGVEWRAEETLTSGPWAYNGAGLAAPLVIVESGDWHSQTTANLKALFLAKRRLGVVRPLKLETVPMPWLEIGDWINIEHDGNTELAQIEKIDLPLTVDGRMRIETRDRTSRTEDMAGIDGRRLR